MSLHPQQSILPVPDDTARIARAAFRRGNPCLLLRDQLGTVFNDADFADLYPKRGQAAYAPWRLALVTLLQFRERLSDRQAAEAVRARIDWKYLLALDLADPGFDHSLLCEFRGRLLAGNVVERLLARVLDVAREGGLLKARGRQRTDSTHVLAAVRELNRIEMLAETLRAALNAITAAVPDWLRALTPPEWHERYGRRIEEMRLPETGPKREAYVVQVGMDGYQLLDALAADDTPTEAVALPAVAVLRRVWARHFECDKGGPDGKLPLKVQLRPVEGRGPGDRIESPYDVDARYRSKSGRSWTGYMVHLTETCDDGNPHLVLHADTTPANVHEAMRVEAIHAALSGKDLAPSQHLVDSAYVSADHLVRAREQHGIDLVGPGRSRTGWQARSQGAFVTADFAIDWEGQVVRCPEGQTSTSWRGYHDKATGPYIRARFSAATCDACPSKPRCTRGRDQDRQLTLPGREQHRALAVARARGDTEQGQRLYALRQGIEGTISQSVNSFGLRRARYRGLAKTGLQSVATAAAINLDRLAAWLAGRP
ncbi:MAG: IS1182 family transposase, partial [Janthinobacterium lividum]